MLMILKAEAAVDDTVHNDASIFSLAVIVVGQR
jgi:hypothetical protein